MRQGQQHRRGRSRGSSGGNGSSQGHHHRKGQNPLSRSFESNGPDVKVRGTAADVASKYMTLARDAQSSGDPVLAENYLQHAEHYNRMIIAYREQQMQQGGDMANGNGRLRHMDEHDDADGEPMDPAGMTDQPPMPGFARHTSQEGQPQPRPEGRHENGRHDDRRQQHGRQQDHRPDHRQDGRSDSRPDSRQDRGERQDRGDHPRFRDRRFDRGGERGERPERTERQERPERPEYRGERSDVPQEPIVRETVPVDQPQPVIEAVEPAPREQAPPRRRERAPDMMKDQPEFLRRPVRRPRREEAPSAAEGSDDKDSGTPDKPTV